MKFFADQNLERRLAERLKELGHDVKVVGLDYPAGILDEIVLSYAVQENRILLTNDRADLENLFFAMVIPTAALSSFGTSDQEI